MNADTPVNNTIQDGSLAENDFVASEDHLLEVPVSVEREEHGPCLFLGASGERCGRLAVDGGFCARHQPGGITALVSVPSRVLAATVTIAVLLWPYIADAVREFLRWMATH